MFNKNMKILFFGLLFVFLLSSVPVNAEDTSIGNKAAPHIQKTKKIDVNKIGNKEIPQVSNDREKVGATGYHCNDCDEPTQERPNPIDAKKAKKKASELQQR